MADLTDANVVRSQKRKTLDRMVFEAIQMFDGLTLDQLEKLKIDIPKKLQKKDAEETKETIKRNFLTNSLARLEGKIEIEGKMEKPKIFSRSKKDIVHGKLVKQYFAIKNDGKDMIVALPQSPLVEEIIENNPVAVIINSTTIIITTSVHAEEEYSNDLSSPIEYIDKSRFGFVIELPNYVGKFFKLENDSSFYTSDPVISSDGTIVIEVNESLESKEKEPLLGKEIGGEIQKNIVFLEDSNLFIERIDGKMKETKHEFKVLTKLEEFQKYIKKNGEKIDVISVDDQVGDKSVAASIIVEIKQNAPNAVVGVMSASIDEESQKQYHEIGYNFVIQKRKRQGKNTSGVMDLDAFIKFLEVV
tara:strand:+ start:854 stop:1933 length:1080 start_codon:yes stop_codon:yes gene_type:complete